MAAPAKFENKNMDSKTYLFRIQTLSLKKKLTDLTVKVISCDSKLFFVEVEVPFKVNTEIVSIFQGSSCRTRSLVDYSPEHR